MLNKKHNTTSIYIAVCCAIMVALLASHIIHFWLFQKYVIFILILFSICNIYVLGFERKRYRFTGDMIINILIIGFIYYFVTYVIGYFIGFSKSNYLLNLKGIFNNCLPIFLIIVFSEINRYMLLNKAKGNKMLIFPIFIAFCLLDIALYSHRYTLTSSIMVYRLLGYLIFPSITKNVYLCYQGMHVGYSPSIIYRCLMELPNYILPFFPAFSDFIRTALLIIMPIINMFSVVYLIKFRHIEKARGNNTASKAILVSIYILFTITIALSSGYFPYYIVTVATGSMTPNINVGDVIIVEKIKKYEKIDVGDVLVFEHNNMLISHRVIDITNNGGKTFYKTKGDYNETADSHLVSTDEISGIVKFKIPLVGYPSVWLTNKLK